MTISKEQLQEIEELRKNKSATIRPMSHELEEILYKPFEVLDHGFVRVIDYMGNDSAIVQAARVSYGKGTKQMSQDKGLINYLIAHKHTTPLEMCEIKLHVKLPIFVARQWIRHRTASVNEYSARYSIMENEFYIPTQAHLAIQSKTNNQGREEGQMLSAEDQKMVLEILKKDSQKCFEDYEKMIDPEGIGLARELARMNLPINLYTQWYWKIDLHNLLHFLRLRADSHAQYEIRVYADIILNEIVKRWVPYTYEAFMKHVKSGKNLSGSAIEVVRKMLKGEKVSQEESGLSKREWGELEELLEVKL
jgi:thymidylate synthase (FAD)